MRTANIFLPAARTQLRRGNRWWFDNFTMPAPTEFAPNEFEALVPSDVRELVPLFLQNRHKELHSLTEAIDAADFKMVHLIGHRMKGSGKAYGFDAISELGLQLEERAKVSDKAELLRLLAKYRQYLANVTVKYQEG
jgi:HPt (histidine-containing phosphotransfer) domain-containing protein